MDARIPMITTTMRSSISVKPRSVLTTYSLPKATQPKGRAEPGLSNAAAQPQAQESCSALGFKPIPSLSDTYDQGNAQFRSTFHLAFYHLFGGALLGLRRLEDQLVVNL